MLIYISEGSYVRRRPVCGNLTEVRLSNACILGKSVLREGSASTKQVLCKWDQAGWFQDQQGGVGWPKQVTGPNKSLVRYK